MSIGTEQATTSEFNPPLLKKDGRYYAGVATLIFACVLPLFAIAVPFMNLSTVAATTVVGLLVAGGPEVLMLIAAALLGKQTLHYFIYRVKHAVCSVVTLQPVSRLRYYVGLMIALVSTIPIYLYGYFPQTSPSGNARIYILAASDLSFIVSVFIMGGEFWEKFRKLFVWEGIG